jgi:hypothetical protein
LNRIKVNILAKSKDCQSELRKELRTRNSERYAKIDEVIGCLPEGCEYSYLAKTSRSGHPIDFIACM